MLSFNQFLTEAESEQDYGEWGIIHPNGKVISGNDHKTANYHQEVTYHALQKNAKSKHPDPSLRGHHFSHYAEDLNTGKLNIRTYTKRGLAGTIKAYDKLPHGTNKQVMHEHYGTDPITKRGYVAISNHGHKARVLQVMKDKLSGMKDD
jgi:hypothetical protein